MHIYFTVIALVSLVASSSTIEKRFTQAAEEIYGPRQNWTTIKLIDIDPQAIIDGQPVNSSVIYAYEPPSTVTIAQRDAVASLFHTTSNAKIQKRALCFRIGSWVSVQQLRSGSKTFCEDSSRKAFDNYRTNQQWKRLWLNPANGQWEHFSTHFGGEWREVFFMVTFGYAKTFNLNECQAALAAAISDCNQSINQDAVGGVVYDFGGSLTSVAVHVGNS